MRSAGKRLLAGSFLILVLTLLAVGGLAQVGGDPRNSDEYLDAVNGASCYAHHAADGFRPFDFGFEKAYTQLPIGEPVTIEVRVRYPHNSMLTGQENIHGIAVLLDKSEAPNVEVVTDDLPDPLDESFTEEIPHGETFQRLVQVFQGASLGSVTATIVQVDPPGIDPRESEAIDPGQLTATFGGHELTGSRTVKELEITREMFQARGPSNWSLEAHWISPFAAIPAQRPVPEFATVEFHIEIEYAAEGTEFAFPAPGNGLVRPATGGDLVVIPITVFITSEDAALLDFRVQGTTFWPHQPGDGAPLDEGLFYRFLTMQVTGGDELMEGRSVTAPGPVGVSVDLYNLFTRLLGFIALLLVLTTTVTGGVFGRASRRWLNRFTGGAKKRVLWHSSAGFLIIVVATFHFALALLDTSDDISKGLFWGGVAWGLLISLGFTGYYQVRMIKRWSYRVWRHVHLWSAIGVLGFLVVHTTLDGSDFAFLREVLPGWYERLLWPKPPSGGVAV